MKIAIYVSELDVKGGTHKQVLRLAEYLASRGHDLYILTSVYDPAKGYPEFARFNVITLPSEPVEQRVTLLSKALNRLRPVRLALRMPRVEIINIHDNHSLLFGIVARLMSKARYYVWQINDLDPAFKIGAHRNDSRLKLREYRQRILNRWMAKKVDAITVNVRKNRVRVREHLDQDAEVFYCGVDFPTTKLSPQVPALLGNFKVLSTGVFFPYRNYETLVRACAEASKRLSQPLSLTIVGDTRYNPGYVESVRALASELAVELSILENLSQSELDACIASSHAFAFINVDQSWGLAVFEAAARSKPVILSRSVGASELLAGKPGFLMVDPLSPIDIANVLVELAKDPARLETEAVSARETAKDMTWARMYCEPIEALFEQLVACQ